MELSSSSSSSKRLKVDSKSMYSDQDPDLDFGALRWSPTFVDKTMLIRSIMKDEDDRILLTAPPRFGKTMACNMLEMFFEIVNSEQQKLEKYDLFEDLNIYKCAQECTDDHDCESKRFFRQHCGQHPVISLDLGCLSATSYDGLLGSLRRVITDQFENYKYLIHKDDETYSWSSNDMGELDIKGFLRYLEHADFDDYWIQANDSDKEQYIFTAFRYLIEVVSVHYQHKKIIMLIDEFDAPFMKMLFSENSDEGIIIFLRELMRLLCKDEVSAKFVQRVMIFAVTALGGMISLGANNVRCRTFLDKDYCKFFGFTKEEVNALVKSSVTESQRQKEALDEIASWYNTYTVIGDKDTTIYNPVSITNYLPNLVRKSYWIEAVGSTYVRQVFKFEKMQEKVYPAIRDDQNISINTTTIQLDDISNLKSLSASILNCINEEQVDLALQFLAECGYFNVVDKNDTNWILQIPNQELKVIFTGTLYNALSSVKTNLFDEKQQQSFVKALNSLACGEENEPMKYVTLKKSVENLYTNRELPKAHFHFHCDLWRLIFDSWNFQYFSKMPIKDGCSPELDLIMITNSTAIIIEVKRHGGDSAKKALEQCLQKEYCRTFQFILGGEVLKKILIGVHLSDDGKVSIRYLENFEEKTLQGKPNKEELIKTIVEASSEC